VAVEELPEGLPDMPGEVEPLAHSSALAETTSSAPALPSGAAGEFPGAMKAAILMAALGPEKAAGVIQRLREEEVERLSVEMAQLPAVGAGTTDKILGEVAAQGGLISAGAAGGMDFAREVIERALGPERAAELLGRLAAAEETRPFAFLRNVAPERIAALLRNESPQMIALVLASLHTGLSAGVLARLPEPLQPDIALRIVRMGVTSARVIEQVESAIRLRLGAVGEREYAAAGGTKALAGILGHADRSVERNVLESLAGEDQALAEEVRGMLFVFEDIVKLEGRAIQQLLREVDQKDLVLALRGAPDNVKEVVMTNMSERGAAMLREEMDIQQPQRKRDVDAAQSRIVGVIRQLEEAGTIVIARGDEEESDAVV
jgi:flagellar motor switch protein FliG